MNVETNLQMFAFSIIWKKEEWQYQNYVEAQYSFAFPSSIGPSIGFALTSSRQLALSFHRVRSSVYNQQRKFKFKKIQRKKSRNKQIRRGERSILDNPKIRGNTFRFAMSVAKFADLGLELVLVFG
jgi:hypothetical protein